MHLLRTLVLLAILSSCLCQKRNIKRKKYNVKVPEEETSSYPPFTSQPTEPEPVNAPDLDDEDVSGVVKDLCTDRSYGCFQGIVTGVRKGCYELLEILRSCEKGELDLPKFINETRHEKGGKWSKVKKVMWEVIKRSKAIDACDTPFGFFPYPDCLKEMVPQLSHLINAVKSVVPQAILAIYGEETTCVKKAFYKIVCLAVLMPGQIFYCTIKALFGIL